MAIKTLVFTCDHCGHEGEEFGDEREALQNGWFVVKGADYIFGSNEKVYCCMDCLRADL